jgi:secretion/DNA translocation related TadE-like protein
MNTQRGSVTIVMAAILAVMVVMTLGAVDVWRVLQVRSRTQVAADAAALAAAQDLALPGDGTPAESAARFASLNGATLATCDCAAGGAGAEVAVWMSVGPLTLFPDDLTVEGRARASVGAGDP